VSGRLCVKLEKGNPAMTLQHITETMKKLALKWGSHTSWYVVWQSGQSGLIPLCTYLASMNC